MHAGCDLIAPVGTPIYAVADGIFVKYYEFYNQTYAIEINHGSFTVRYGEVQPPYEEANDKWGNNAPPQKQCKGISNEIRKDGSHVKRGQLIGWVGQLRTKAKKGMKNGSHMLHFEMYANTKNGPLTINNHKHYDHVPIKSYQRRSDLLNPTDYLDKAKNA